MADDDYNNLDMRFPNILATGRCDCIIQVDMLGAAF
ncbi:hypothetical protein BVRB_1g017320 [Beta vulgaris subsp. vulgaris]|nr:hypothetical protein BVRB_1g017320 [Beta vulgaris subsp. vulgaris]